MYFKTLHLKPYTSNYYFMLLKIDNITKNFGGLAALWKLSFQVNEGEILGLLGPNGSGKTTLFNVVSGFFPPSAGRIFFDGKDITGLRPHRIARIGVVRTFQGTNLFKNRTVWENVVIAHHLMIEANFVELLLNQARAKTSEAAAIRHSQEILEYLDLLGSERMIRPRICPTAFSGPWAWPLPWPPGPAYCSWMNP